MTSIVVFGAGGRAGRAIVAEAQSRGLTVVPVVRDPARHPDLPGAVPGDVTDPAAVAAIVSGHHAAVNAVSPFSGPDQLARGGLDPDHFVKAADALTGSGVPRVVAIGLFSNLDGAGPLPEQFRAFGDAHTAGLHRLRASGADWVMLTPPASLSLDNPSTGRYRLGGEAAEEGSLSYADLALAVIDEIEKPTLHRTRAAIVSEG
ncbi:putative NADH-flavin reductase [Actinoplanes octamycinicus]|uniref:Putative NADH-flavin reductase n=1 Tax=Actinoplanes octamycinicus TaxID=135948 RepID=A0A7W7MB76_9ACTN|nr:NAD(P)H-binding protein [Actinoplanes octamycinicus]MBB4743701.1 putative NADH-flavin reductase [Actinoplanes octamycinicus]